MTDRRPHRSRPAFIHAIATAAAFAAIAGCGAGGESTATSSSATTGSASEGSTATSVPAPTSSPETTTASTSVAPPTTAADWTPIGDGEYQVGAATIVLDDPVRPLTVEVWFPLDPASDTANPTPQRYSLLPAVYIDSDAAVAATPSDLVPDTRFPLVVYSHGSGGLRYINASYTEAIASHGYVVVAADHTGNTAVDTLAGNELPDTMFADRVNDVHRLIDAFTNATGDSPAAAFAAGVDGDRIAVAGHSFGGWTAVAAATGSDDPPGATEGDQRIDAIIPIAPAITGLLTPDRLATLTQPMLIIVGTDDTSTPIQPHTDDLWNETTDTPAYRVEIEGAEHQSFTDVCIYQDELARLPDVPEVVIETLDGYATAGCEPDDLPWERAHEIAVSYTVDFLDEVLGGDPAAIPPAAPDDANVTSR